MSGKRPLKYSLLDLHIRTSVRLRPGQQGHCLTTSYVPVTVVVTVTLPWACCRGAAGKRGGCAGRSAACAIPRKRNRNRNGNGNGNWNQHVRDAGIFKDVVTCSVLGLRDFPRLKSVIMASHCRGIQTLTKNETIFYDRRAYILLEFEAGS